MRKSALLGSLGDAAAMKGEIFGTAIGPGRVGTSAFGAGRRTGSAVGRGAGLADARIANDAHSGGMTGAELGGFGLGFRPTERS